MATDKQNPKTPKKEVGVDVDTYDRGIVPAETAARKEREGGSFKQTPKEIAREENEQTGGGSMDTTSGYTVDKEGLVDNFAIEPEMYVDEPGDLREEYAEDAEHRKEELYEANQDKDGKLTMEEDKRGRGPGVI
ncbi:hypothetical protein H6G20_06760 [Desertifilum sp. FACHB-1129]|uniref:Uncharacterized protein n=2 Tax=Desertifilum tharense IPPAS B-1220 TaxID=1781255 RepID=A0A1E5QD88_9CYAN|nr:MULTISPECIES: hypothetical protein [Desertifilum]MDA0212314.1 hypothetical protein [Cyanobacteria bacterium FC1]MBD2311356.1 hypothetical protein [Desertifilum sp. FACHB-1129]MBD2321602.1 hypothetical protein [Desertifilum sp. FACHB-866]MBD2331729.1 hypothetical protein [Desertifilum sp. FACHB-868]OEJ72597.1 hypothetical protein BH720_24160 [Desertifilum tharense IPPAS B-1220]